MEPGTIAAIASFVAGWFNKDDKSDGSGFAQTVAAINQSLGTITTAIIENVWQAVLGANNTRDEKDDAILRQVILSEGGVKDAIGNSERNLLDFIEYAARAVDRESYNRDRNIESVIRNGNTSVLDSLGRAVIDIVTPITVGNDILGNQLTGIDLKIDSRFSVVEQVMREIITFMERKVEYIIENTVILDSDIFDVILGKVRDLLGDRSDEMRQVVGVFDDLINGTFADAMQTNNIIAVGDLTETKRMADALDIVADAAKAEKQRHIGVDGEPIVPATPMDNITDLINAGSEEFKEAWAALRGFMLEDADGANPDDDCLLPLLTRGPGKGFGWWIANTLTLALAAGVLPFQMATIQANRKLQGFRTCFPDQLLSPPQMREMYHILGYERKELVQLFQRQGYSKDDANIIMQTWETPPDLVLLFTMYFREEIGKPELTNELRKHGFRPDMIKSIIDVSLYLPPVQDLITMSVRDVFDEATVNRNRQYEDYPPDFTKYMKQQGVTEYWARQYWAAHWRLPSETMGFEMFHRAIINEEELKGLMKSLDIMPGWRDRLIKLSYNPLTRVDIRRMYSVGVVSKEEVTRAYLDIGYSPDNAKRLTDFTVKLTEEESLLSPNVAGDLTTSNILGFYKDHVIKREVALALLLQDGNNAVASELLLKSADFDIERKERGQLRDLILSRFKTGRYSYEQAVAETQRLGFQDREKEAIILDLELIQAKENKIPPRADLDKMLKGELIDTDTYLAAMAANGYAPFWAEKYLAMVK